MLGLEVGEKGYLMMPVSRIKDPVLSPYPLAIE